MGLLIMSFLFNCTVRSKSSKWFQNHTPFNLGRLQATTHTSLIWQPLHCQQSVSSWLDSCQLPGISVKQNISHGRVWHWQSKEKDTFLYMYMYCICTPVVRFSDVYWILPLCYYWWLQPYTTLNENWNQPLNGRLFSRTLHSSPVSSCKCCVISVVCSLTDCQADPVWSSEMQLFSFVNPPFLLLLCRSWEKHLRPCG